MANTSNYNYETIDSPYNNTLFREDTTFDIIPTEDQAYYLNDPNEIGSNILSGNTFENIWVKTWIKSRNYQPKTKGFYFDGKGGYIEFQKANIGSLLIQNRVGKNDINENVFEMYFEEDAKNGKRNYMFLGTSGLANLNSPYDIHTDVFQTVVDQQINFAVSSRWPGADIKITTSDGPNEASWNSGGSRIFLIGKQTTVAAPINISDSSGGGGVLLGLNVDAGFDLKAWIDEDAVWIWHELLPYDTGVSNLGNATYYWNDISYKTLTDRGCLSILDDGVELQDGTIVSDLEALLSIKKHPTKKTIYEKPMMDYKSLPKIVYKPATGNKGNKLQRDENDEPYVEINGQKKMAADGAETTALISIMIGAIKELANRIENLENKT